jgi:hypothetical protein
MRTALTMLNRALFLDKIPFLLATLLVAPAAARAVELEGFSLGAPKVATLSQLAKVSPLGAMIRCSVNYRSRTEECRVNWSGTRFALLGVPLEKIFVEFSSGTTDVMEFQFRARGDQEQVYAQALQAVTDKLSTPTERYAKGVRWEGDGCVATLHRVEGGGVALLLMRVSTKAHEPSSNIASERRRGALIAELGRPPTRSSM